MTSSSCGNVWLFSFFLFSDHVEVVHHLVAVVPYKERPLADVILHLYYVAETVRVFDVYFFSSTGYGVNRISKVGLTKRLILTFTTVRRISIDILNVRIRD